jgi:hypothetical protein
MCRYVSVQMYGIEICHPECSKGSFGDIHIDEQAIAFNMQAYYIIPCNEPPLTPIASISFSTAGSFSKTGAWCGFIRASIIRGP